MKDDQVSTSDGGRRAGPTVPPGVYQVQIKQPWFQMFQQLVSLKEKQTAWVYAVLEVARAMDEVTVTGSPTALQGPGAPRAVRAGGKVQGLKRLSGRLPAWPVTAQSAGDVALYATVTAEGTIKNISVLESADPELEKEAVAAYQTWKFEAMKLDGQPVECRHVLVFHFR